MEQIVIKLTPSNTNNPIITRTTSEPQVILNDVAHDTYTMAITSEVYKPYNTQIVLSGDTELNIHLEALVTQFVEWRTQSKVTTIPISTVYTDDATLNVGIEITDSEGTVGKTTETWESQYIDNVATGQKRNQSSTTIPMIPKQVRRGTKPIEVDLVNILTQANAKATYATNIFVNNVRTTQDAIPVDGSAFEMRQWDNPTGGISIYNGNLQPSSTYTIVMEMENVGAIIDKAHFVIGLQFFEGQHFFNDTLVTITPNAGQYNFKPHMPSSGKVTYRYQFNTLPGAPAEDYFQVNFDNAANNTKVKISKLSLYKGTISGGV